MPRLPALAILHTRRLAATACLCAWLSSGIANPGFAQPTTSVLLENLVNGQIDDSVALTDADGVTRLSAGTTADGDGAIVALGYFTGATEAAGFAGKWIPLSGPAAASAGIASTTIGDTNSQAAGAFGFIAAQVDFDAGSKNHAGFRNTPPAGARLAVAIYNAATLQAATRFTIATNDAWRWRAPAEPLPEQLYINLNDPGTIWLGGAANARRTSAPIATFPGLAPAGRLVNISTRGFVGTGDAVMIPGFVLEGSGTTAILARAAGPTLATKPFNVSGVLSDPTLILNGIANDDWHTFADLAALESATARTGAFPLQAGGKDAAALTLLSSGSHTVNVSGKAGGTGVALAEVYLVDIDNPAAPRIKNISTRGFAGGGDAIMIAGFVVDAGGPQRLLIRAAGPTLAEAPFHIGGALERPRLDIFSSTGGPALATNDGWERDGEGPRLAAAAAQVGAFPLTEGSRDAAVLFVAEPGGYTVQISGGDGSSGIVIAEVYELP